MPIVTPEKETGQTIWIIFTNDTDIKWLKLLKKNFRHCFALIQSPQGWITIDPLYLNIDIQQFEDLNKKVFLPDWFKSQGYQVVQTTMKKPLRRKIYFSPYSCVEVIKKILGLNKFFILTPWQLYCHLIKERN